MWLWGSRETREKEETIEFIHVQMWLLTPCIPVGLEEGSFQGLQEDFFLDNDECHHLKVVNWFLDQCCKSGSGSAWIRIDFGWLDLDPGGQKRPTKKK
jgi:hypothetical protein